MVQENDPIVFSDWIGPALLFFVLVGVVLGLLVLGVGFLVAAFRMGPMAGGDAVYRMLRTGLIDVVSMSPRRILALARLAVQESLRRSVLIALVVFLLILLFAGWFLDTKSNEPASLYLSFVLTTTTYLVLLIALFLSAFSLPADIKNHTIYTVVTKPVRSGEIVLGRILGFTAIGTALLALMGLFSYFFVVRVLDHAHEVDVATLKTSGPSGETLVGKTTSALGHRHTVTIDADGHGSTDIVQGHWHEVTRKTEGDKTNYQMGPPLDLLAARVPLRAAQLRFKDRLGKASDRGVSVGNEWKYRTYVEGGTLAEAIWTFQDVTPQRFPEGLPIEMTVRVFRSYKGDIEKGILGSLVLRNPRTGLSSEMKTFSAKEFYIDRIDIGRTLTDKTGHAIDLFDDLAPDGELEISLQCLDEAQYFGAAKADIYLRAGDASFALNFIKSYLGIWAQMVLVISFGVMFSTFLSGPVAALATVSSVLLGFFTQFVVDLATGTQIGGGPVESLIRLVKQQNMTLQLEPGINKSVAQGADSMFLFVLQKIAGLVPDFRKFDSINFVAHGFDIPIGDAAAQACTALAYVAGVFAVGYFFLRTREVAK